MNAQQFIKDHGLEKARDVVAASANALVQCKDDSTFHVNDLKCLVESVDIIKDLEGIEGAKGTLTELVKLDWDEFEHRWIDGWMCTKSRLEQAITNYESIYGEGDV